MLLLTDRSESNSRLLSILDRIQACRIVSVQTDEVLDRHPSMIVCDAAMDSSAATERVRSALARYRPHSRIPLIVLLRDPSELAKAQAQALGASVALPCTVEADRLIAIVIGLMSSVPGNQPPKLEDEATTVSVGETATMLASLMDDVRRRRLISPDILQHSSNVVLAAIKRADLRSWLKIVWAYDDITYQHCLLVAGIAAAFALKLGLSPHSQAFISQSALLHDIGKAAIPSAILNKPGRLTAPELTVMRQHTTIGHGMLLNQPQLDSRFLAVVRHHHEYLDGTGYPDGLTGEKIPDFVRLITISDIYAAMIERRSYKEPASPAVAYSQLQAMGARLDRALVQAFQTVAQVEAS